MSKLLTYQCDGVDYEISVDNTGSFFTTMEGELVQSPTLEALKKKIGAKQRRKTIKLNLPATIREAGSWRSTGKKPTFIQVQVTGIHSRNKNVLYRREDNGKADSVGYSDDIYKRLTPADIAEYLRLWQATVDAEKAFDDFKTKHTYTKQAIGEAIAAAEKKAGIEPEED